MYTIFAQLKTDKIKSAPGLSDTLLVSDSRLDCTHPVGGCNSEID